MGKPATGGDKPATPPGDDPTYQELLDESLEETFPASDPISPSSLAERAQRAVSTDKDDTDWKLQPGSEVPPDPAADTAEGDGATREDAGTKAKAKPAAKAKDKGKSPPAARRSAAAR